ncbi:hypothetical protein [Laspinema olomoucense]|uniref:hypothetical protein n=1 Tax=Laspinema olomoucense TaxID=3231600 RepID=UPI0021BA444D|nr:hypothetical protein [Laspinema sp. D3d]MCT7976014.1 hypothetical protein [Laspinema sp. D3d]
MKINRSKLCAIALLTTINVVPSLAVAQVAPRSELNRHYRSISQNHVGDFCILLGPIRDYADVILEWGPFQGTRRIDRNPNRPNQIHGVNVYAKGNNEPSLTIYASRGLDREFPQIIESRCQDTPYGISNPPYLDWSDR